MYKQKIIDATVVGIDRMLKELNDAGDKIVHILNYGTRLIFIYESEEKTKKKKAE